MADILTPTYDLTANAKKLQDKTTGCRISFKWLGVTRTVSASQKGEAAEVFDADPKSLGVSKKILDTKHAAFRAVAAVKDRARKYWAGITLPWTEDSIRLLRKDDIEPFNVKAIEFKQELHETVKELDTVYWELRNKAFADLGSLYNEADYPPSLSDSFGFVWEFCSVNPPDYLMQLHPAIYAEQAAKVEAKFATAVAMAEEAFVEKFSELVNHLADRLTGVKDGKPVIFHASNVENLVDFFAQFKHLNITCSENLDALVEQAQKLVVGVSAKDIRSDGVLRSKLAEDMKNVASQLDTLMVAAPRRKLNLPPAPSPIVEESDVVVFSPATV